MPVADGGDGLVDIAIETLGGTARTVTVTGPDSEPVAAAFCYVPEMRFAAIEMALASGLALLADDRRNPMTATTQGTGQLIRAALELDVTHVAVGIGGSATNDGGIGMAAALGVRFLDDAGNDVAPIAANLARIRRVDLSQRLPGVARVRFEAVCDVDNPLCGERGASAIYGPQREPRPSRSQSSTPGLPIWPP